MLTMKWRWPCILHAHALYGANTQTELCPPKPNELEMAAVMSWLCLTLGTMLMPALAISSMGVVWLIVGWTSPTDVTTIQTLQSSTPVNTVLQYSQHVHNILPWPQLTPNHCKTKQSENGYGMHILMATNLILRPPYMLSWFHNCTMCHPGHCLSRYDNKATRKMTLFTVKNAKHWMQFWEHNHWCHLH